MQGKITGEVLFGINTIYSVAAGGARVQCRIKGKKLKEEARSYDPIAAGDMVELVPDALSPAEGMISDLVPRRTKLVRWNKRAARPR